MSSRFQRNGPRLFCGSTANSFTTVEHPFAESVVGPNPKVLPRGTVCDDCNHGVCARLDAVLAAFSPIALLRVSLGITGKGGKQPTARFQNAHPSSSRR